MSYAWPPAHADVKLFGPKVSHRSRRKMRDSSIRPIGTILYSAQAQGTDGTPVCLQKVRDIVKYIGYSMANDMRSRVPASNKMPEEM
jgi:hypothetical protein